MTFQTLFWIYLANTVLLILHEMDSVYWKEWGLFGLPGGITGFLLLHVPLYPVVLYGLVLISQDAPAGLVLSLILGTAGILAFGLHTYFLTRGRREFGTVMSKSILGFLLAVSLVQIAITLALLTSPS